MGAIKFRAWDKDYKKWLFSYKQSGGFSLFGEIIMLGEWEAIPLSKLNRLAVTQFTGMKDKDGKEIWESDFVKIKGRCFEVVRVEYLGCYGLKINANKIQHFTSGFIGQDEFEGHNWLTNVEVIGNIFENPELGHIPVPQPQNIA